MKWLDDEPNLDKLSICIRERSKKGKKGYSLTFSKAFKDYVVSGKYSFIRFGHDVVNGSKYIVLQLNEDDIGLPLLNEKEQVRLWMDITSYFEQYKSNDIYIPLDIDLPVKIRKNGTLEIELQQSQSEDHE